MPEASVVSVSRERDGVALIHLNRPPANSYDRAFLDALNAAVDEVRWDGDIGAAVLVSDLAPRFFSAGADITNFQRTTRTHRSRTWFHLPKTLSKIERRLRWLLAPSAATARGGALKTAL